MKTKPEAPTEDDERIGMYGSKAAGREWNWNHVVHGLGLICIEFQMLETALQAGISELVAIDDPILGTLITAEVSFKGLLDLLFAVFEYEWEGSDRPKQLKPILDRCHAAESKRNQLIHSNWYPY
jgi:hypothetical protein